MKDLTNVLIGASLAGILLATGSCFYGFTDSSKTENNQTVGSQRNIRRMDHDAKCVDGGLAVGGLSLTGLMFGCYNKRKVKAEYRPPYAFYLE